LLNENCVQGDHPRRLLIPFIVPDGAFSDRFLGGCSTASFPLSPGRWKKLHLISTNIDFLGDPWTARWSVNFRQYLARRTVHRRLRYWRDCDGIRRPSTRPATIDGGFRWQRFRSSPIRC